MAVAGQGNSGIFDELYKEAKNRESAGANQSVVTGGGLDVGVEAGDMPKARGSVYDKIAEIFKSNKFQESGGLAKEITEFSETVNAALAKFDATTGSTPAVAFENNTRHAATGVDSLAAIGAGGNVYLGLSVLDVNKMQLRELKEINVKLSNRALFPSNPGMWESDDDQEISRTQTSPVAQ